MKTSVPKHALLVNPTSGKGKAPNQIRDIYEFCKGQLGDVTLFAPSHASGMKQITESLSDAGCKSFVVLGGDGTLNLIAERLIAAKNTTTSICVLNNDASDSDLSMTIWANTANHERLACLVENRSELIDTLEIEDSNGKTFIALNSCSIGAPASLIKKREELPQTWPRWTKSVLPSLQSIVKPHIIRTHKNGEAIAMIFSNGKFGGGGLQFAPEAKLSDGQFNITTVRPGSFFNYLTTLPRVFSQGLVQGALIEKSTTDTINVICKNSVIWERDGECGETRGLTIKCRPTSLRMVVPSR